MVIEGLSHSGGGSEAFNLYMSPDNGSTYTGNAFPITTAVAGLLQAPGRLVLARR